jgi:hypothetical protein
MSPLAISQPQPRKDFQSATFTTLFARGPKMTCDDFTTYLSRIAAGANPLIALAVWVLLGYVFYRGVQRVVLRRLG